jgi:hypothetical protein
MESPMTTDKIPSRPSRRTLGVAGAFLLALLATAGRPAVAQGESVGDPGDLNADVAGVAEVADASNASNASNTDPAGPDATPGAYGYFRIIDGAATLVAAGSGERSVPQVNQPVMAGDRILVADKARVEIVLSDRNLVRLDGGSNLVLTQLAATPDTHDGQTLLRLDEGNFQLVVMQDALGDRLPRIDTPNATVYVQYPGTYRITSDQGDWTSVLVRRGSVEVVTPRGSRRVRADQEAHVEGREDAQAEIAQAGAYDAIERWGRDLEARVADNGNLDPSLRYEGSSLDRYGSWIDVGGQRYWRPTAADDGDWSPYSDGSWTYTPSGLTWVASEPWGWVPYHYGTWDYLDDYGWAWEPGAVYSPAWVYWYWGPSEVGWCPVGYYTGWYGRHFHDPAFRHGVYGWAGGNRGSFKRWNFTDHGHLGHLDRGRFVRHGGDLRGDMKAVQLPRGLITTDTRGLTPARWQHPDLALDVLRAHGHRGVDGLRNSGTLPDVTSFVAREPNLSPQVLGRVTANPLDKNRFSGTPLRPLSLVQKSPGQNPAAGPVPARGHWADRTPAQTRRGTTPAGITGTNGDRIVLSGRNPAQPGLAIHTWDRRGTSTSPTSPASVPATRNREAWRELPTAPRDGRPGDRSLRTTAPMSPMSPTSPMTLTVVPPVSGTPSQGRQRPVWREVPTPTGPGTERTDRGERPQTRPDARGDATPRTLPRNVPYRYTAPPQGQAQGQAPRSYSPPPQRSSPPPQQHSSPPPSHQESQRPTTAAPQKPPEHHGR